MKRLRIRHEKYKGRNGKNRGRKNEHGYMGVDRGCAAAGRSRRGEKHPDKTGNAEKNPSKMCIDRLYYIGMIMNARLEEQDSAGTVCPKCCAGFAGTREYESDFAEEMALWEDE